MMGNWTSVWEGKDGAWIDGAMSFYRGSGPILDITSNQGRMWRGSNRIPITLDCTRMVGVQIQADHCALPIREQTVGVVVYDPPHIPNQGNSSKGLAAAFGTFGSYEMSYRGALNESYRVVREGGLLFAKISDYVHNHKSFWPHARFIQEAEAAGWTVCDMVVKVRRGPMEGRWFVHHHARKRHCYWIVCRKGKCE